MSASQARVATDRARRYLAQLCEHGEKMSHRALHHIRRGGEDGDSPHARHAEHSDTDGIIDFGQGRCTLHATDTELLLRVEADDERHLRRIEDGIAARVERVGRRDKLSVTWARSPEDHPSS
jgi:hypothetical protein